MTDTTAEALAGRVGERVRALRAARNLSLSALAEASGVGKGSLSELENGTRNPTLATLYSIAGPLGVPLEALLADAGAGADSDGVAVTLLEARREGAVVREVYALQLAPGAHRVSPPHGPGVVEHLLVTAGEARVGAADAERTLAVGHCHAWASDVEHTYAGGPAGASGVLTITTPESEPARTLGR